MPLLELRKVSKMYPSGGRGIRALDQVSLIVEPGEFVCVAGPSGSGKSTLLQIAGILEDPSEGTVLLDGRETQGLSRSAAALLRRARIGFVFQQFNLIPVLTAYENVEYGLLLRRVPEGERRQRVREILAAVGLEGQGGLLPSQLSGGQQQRVAVARAVVTRPALVLADEPTGSLDSRTGRQLIELFAEINRRDKTTFLFSSHDPRMIEQSQRVLRLFDGRLEGA